MEAMASAPVPPRLLRLDADDNVAVAITPLSAGERLAVPGVEGELVVTEPIAFGHKVALAAISAGEAVRKYGEVIGIATAPVAPGAHVHVHNVVSARLPGASGTPAGATAGTVAS